MIVISLLSLQTNSSNNSGISFTEHTSNHVPNQISGNDCIDTIVVEDDNEECNFDLKEASSKIKNAKSGQELINLIDLFPCSQKLNCTGMVFARILTIFKKTISTVHSNQSIKE